MADASDDPDTMMRVPRSVAVMLKTMTAMDGRTVVNFNRNELRKWVTRLYDARMRRAKVPTEVGR